MANDDQLSPTLDYRVLRTSRRRWSLPLTPSEATVAVVAGVLLPVSCFHDASAASALEPTFVGGAPTACIDGNVYLVNTQVRRLKCVEIGLAAIWPAGHRFLRMIYDHVGPPLARVIRAHPLLGDIAFVTLKPFEWIGFGVVVAAAPRARFTARSIYPSVYSEHQATLGASPCKQPPFQLQVEITVE